MKSSQLFFVCIQLRTLLHGMWVYVCVQNILRDILQFDTTIVEAEARLTNANRTCDLILGVGDGKACYVCCCLIQCAAIDHCRVIDDMTVHSLASSVESSTRTPWPTSLMTSILSQWLTGTRQFPTLYTLVSDTLYEWDVSVAKW